MTCPNQEWVVTVELLIRLTFLSGSGLQLACARVWQHVEALESVQNQSALPNTVHSLLLLSRACSTASVSFKLH